MLFDWIGSQVAKGALNKSKKDGEAYLLGIASHILEIVKAPSQRAITLWNGLSPEDQKLFKEAALAAAKMAAKALIASQSGSGGQIAGGKVAF